MKPFPITLILGFLLTFSAYAKLPKVESLKPDESLTVEREMSEPRINRYEFIFTQGSVSITYNKKKLGVLKITKADAQMIDQFLYSVKRGRKSGRRHLGTPVYTIVSKKAEEKAVEWTYKIVEPKKISKPVLSLQDLIIKLEEQNKLLNKPEPVKVPAK